jgi:Arc-like DNA binding domain
MTARGSTSLVGPVEMGVPQRSIRSRTARTISLACEAAFRSACAAIHSFTSAGSRTINFDIVRLCILTPHRKTSTEATGHNISAALVASGHNVKRYIEMGHRGAKMAKEFPSRALDKVILRLPDGMRDRLAEAAVANNRTMNAEAVSRLQKSFDVGLSGWGGLRLRHPDGTYFTEEEALARPLDMPILQESHESRIGDQLERGFSRLEGQIDRLEKRLERVEKGLLVPPPIPKGPLWPPSKQKSQKD